MRRAAFEVADIVRAAPDSFFDRSPWLTWAHMKALLAITRCRTAALGGHLDRCTNCGHEAISYNSCRNRHCPKCQTNARDRWLAARERDLLPVPYAHVVFTLPQPLAAVTLQNKAEVFNLLFRSASDTLLEVARDPKYLGADIGFFAVLHTWNQQLLFHPHVHCVVPAGGLSPDHTRWVAAQRGFFLPVKALGRVFRVKFVAGLRALHDARRLGFHGRLAPLAEARAFAAFLRTLFRCDWVVYCKRPFRGAEHALRYLGCYTHRVAISNHRIVSVADGRVTFRWRDSAHKNKKRLLALDAGEFLRRFLLHLLPPGFVRIRYFGFFAHRRRPTLVPLCFQLLHQHAPARPAAPTAVTHKLWTCPRCGGPMLIIERLSYVRCLLRSPPPRALAP